MKKLWIVSIMLLLTPSFLCAQEVAKTKDSTKKEAVDTRTIEEHARHYLYRIKAMELIKYNFGLQLRQEMDEFVKGKNCLPEDIHFQLLEAIWKSMDLGAIEAYFVELLVADFSKQELKELSLFYRTLTGNKFIDLQRIQAGLAPSVEKPQLYVHEKQIVDYFLESEAGKKEQSRGGEIMRDVLRKMSDKLPDSEERVGKVLREYLDADGTCK